VEIKDSSWDTDAKHQAARRWSQRQQLGNWDGGLPGLPNPQKLGKMLDTMAVLKTA